MTAHAELMDLSFQQFEGSWLCLGGELLVSFLFCDHQLGLNE